MLPDAGSWMATSQQDALDRQGDLFDAESAEARRPDPERVRRRIDGILAELRGEISARHWEFGRASFLRMAFPGLTRWLPGDEAARLESEFEREMARLGTG